MFAHVLHCPPPVVDELSVSDFLHLCAWLEEFKRREDEAAAKLREAGKP